MLKVSGALLLLLGAAGFSFSICAEQKKKLILLKSIKEMYRLLQSEICYTALPLPEIFKAVGEKMETPLREALFSVSQSMALENGEDFLQVWEQKMKECLNGTSLAKQQKALLLKLPECMGMNNSTGQAEVLEKYIGELDRLIVQMEEEEKNKNKVIMSLGIAAGLFVVIILL